MKNGLIVSTNIIAKAGSEPNFSPLAQSAFTSGPLGQPPSHSLSEYKNATKNIIDFEAERFSHSGDKQIASIANSMCVILSHKYLNANLVRKCLKIVYSKAELFERGLSSEISFKNCFDMYIKIRSIRNKFDPHAKSLSTKIIASLLESADRVGNLLAIVNICHPRNASSVSDQNKLLRSLDRVIAEKSDSNLYDFTKFHRVAGLIAVDSQKYYRSQLISLAKKNCESANGILKILADRILREEVKFLFSSYPVTDAINDKIRCSEQAKLKLELNKKLADLFQKKPSANEYAMQLDHILETWKKRDIACTPYNGRHAASEIIFATYGHSSSKLSLLTEILAHQLTFEDIDWLPKILKDENIDLTLLAKWITHLPSHVLDSNKRIVRSEAFSYFNFNEGFETALKLALKNKPAIKIILSELHSMDDKSLAAFSSMFASLNFNLKLGARASLIRNLIENRLLGEKESDLKFSSYINKRLIKDLFLDEKNADADQSKFELTQILSKLDYEELYKFLSNLINSPRFNVNLSQKLSTIVGEYCLQGIRFAPDHLAYTRLLLKYLEREGKASSAFSPVVNYLKECGLPKSLVDFDHKKGDYTGDWCSANLPQYFVNVLSDSLRCISDLEQLHPGSASYMNRNCGISIFGRYPAYLLAKQYAFLKDSSNRYQGQAALAAFFPVHDWNGAFYQGPHVYFLEEEASRKGNRLPIIIMESNSDRGLLRKFLKVRNFCGEIQYALICAHGDEEGLTLGSEGESRHLYSKSIKDTSVKRLIKSIFAQNSQIVVSSCKSGVKEGFACTLFEVLDEHNSIVISTDKKALISDIRIEHRRGARPKFIAEFSTSSIPGRNYATVIYE